MLNNRMCMIKQRTEIENLQDENENLLKDLKELSLENSTLKEKLQEKDLKIAELYLKLSKATGELDKIINCVNMFNEDILRNIKIGD